MALANEIEIGSIWRCQNTAHSSILVRVVRLNGNSVGFEGYQGPRKHRRRYTLRQERFLMAYRPL